MMSRGRSRWRRIGGSDSTLQATISTSEFTTERTLCLLVETLSEKMPTSVQTVPAVMSARGPKESKVGPICTPQIQFTKA